MNEKQMEKFRVYAVAISALEYRTDLRPDGQVREGSTYYTLPGLMLAPDRATAGKMALDKAFDKWPSPQFYSHQSAVLPVTKQFFDFALGALEAGMIDEDGDEDGGMVFQ